MSEGPNEIERKAVEKRLRDSGIAPETVDINEHWDSSLNYSENIRNIEQNELEGKTIETARQQEASLKAEAEAGAMQEEAKYGRQEGMSGAEAEHWRKEREMEVEAKRIAKEREEGYKKEGDLLEKYFSTPEEKKTSSAMAERNAIKKEDDSVQKYLGKKDYKQEDLESVPNIGPRQYKRVPPRKGILEKVAVGAKQVLNPAVGYIEERTALNPWSSPEHVIARRRYLSRTAPVYEQESRVAFQKHKIAGYKLAEERSKIAIAQQKKQLAMSYGGRGGAGGAIESFRTAFPNRMKTNNLPFLGEIAVTKGGGLLSTQLPNPLRRAGIPERPNNQGKKKK